MPTCTQYTNMQYPHATCRYADKICMHERHAHYSHLAQAKDQSSWLSPQGDFPHSLKLLRSQARLETNIRDRWEVKSPGVRCITYQGCTYRFECSKDCVQKQIGKSYVYSCSFLQTWSHCTYIYSCINGLAWPISLTD